MATVGHVWTKTENGRSENEGVRGRSERVDLGF